MSGLSVRSTVQWSTARWSRTVNPLCWGKVSYARSSLHSNIATNPSQPLEIAHQLNDSNSTIIFIAPALLPAFEKARSHVNTTFPNERIVLLCKPKDKPEGSPFKLISEIFGEPAEPEQFNGRDAQDVAWLGYSSGTTGLPKGVMTTHFNLTSQMQAAVQGIEHLESGLDCVLGVLPMSHVYGLAYLLMMPSRQGVPVVILPRFDEEATLHAIQKVCLPPRYG